MPENMKYFDPDKYLSPPPDHIDECICAGCHESRHIVSHASIEAFAEEGCEECIKSVKSWEEEK